jgi:hypothetical protein
MKTLVIMLCFSLAITAMLYVNNQHLQENLVAQGENYEQKIKDQHQSYQKKITDLEDFIAFGKGTLQVNNLTNTKSSSPSNTTNNNKLEAFATIQQENIERTITQKYAILFSTLSLSSQGQDSLRELLMERERILGLSSVGYFSSKEDIAENIRKQQESIADIDRKIAQLLKPEEVNQYELLKDSAYEQFQMNSFYEGLGSGNSLSEAKKHLLLLNKLEQKQAFTQILQKSGQDIEHASAAEKPYQIEKAHQSLLDYKDNYLLTAKANLSEEQFNALRDYEQQQFEEMWQSLKAGWQVEQTPEE